MSEWTRLFGELRRVYGQASELLLDADRLLDAAGFECVHSQPRAVGAERSRAVDSPDYWAPQWLARFYYAPKKSPPAGPLLYVACVISDGGKASDYQLPGAEEPVLTCGVLWYREGADWSWYYWNAKYWLWHDKKTWPQLTWTETRSDRLRSQGVERLESFGIPLVGIKSRIDLDSQAIQPLLARAGIQPAEEPDVE